MLANQIPPYDKADNLTGCCPRFHPEGWENQELRFEQKPFVKASTVSLFHMPLNMGSVYDKTWRAIQTAHAEGGTFLVLTEDTSPWHAEHYFSVDRDVPGAEMVRMTGTFLTKVFDGPFSDAPKWCDALKKLAVDHNKHAEKLFYFYTTCPKCSKVYGHNYVVGLAQVD